MTYNIRIQQSVVTRYYDVICHEMRSEEPQTKQQPTTEKLLTKQELAARLDLTKRGIESLVKARRIPCLRITNKIVRFDWPRVQAALAGYEVKAISK